MNWRTVREKTGTVRAGQYWKKSDTGRIMQVRGKNTDNCWTVQYEGHGTNNSHYLKERDIYKYYEKL